MNINPKNISKMKNKFLSCTIFQDKLYFISEAEHILMRMDINSGKIECIDNPIMYHIDECIYGKWKLADRMVSFDGKVYILEADGGQLIEYFVSENRQRCFDISCSAYGCSNNAAFTIYKNRAYIFPSFLNKIVIVNLNSGEITYKQNFCTDILYKFSNEGNIPPKLFSCGSRIGNCEWIFLQYGKEVLEYDLEAEVIRRHKIPGVINGCVHAEWKENLFYILDLDGRLFSWDVKTGNIEQWLLEKKAYPEYREMVVTDKKIWILPDFGEDILLIDKKTKKMQKYSNYPSDFSYDAPQEYSKYYVHCEDEGYYYFSMHSGNYIFSVEKKSGRERWIRPYFEEKEEIFKYYCKNNICIEENKCGFFLPDYVNYTNWHNRLSNKWGCYAGQKIWERLSDYESM